MKNLTKVMAAHVIVFALLLTASLGPANSIVPAVAAQEPYPVYTCEQCFEDSLLVERREDRCAFVFGHCSPCYWLVVFWCYDGVPREERKRILREYLLPKGKETLDEQRTKRLDDEFATNRQQLHLSPSEGQSGGSLPGAADCREGAGAPDRNVVSR